MNDKNINKIFRSIVEAAPVSFDYNTTSSGTFRVKGVPTLLRSNKNGSYFLAVTQPGYGYATWSLDKAKNIRFSKSIND